MFVKSFVFCVLTITIVSSQKFVIPDITITPLSSGGLTVRMIDSKGIDHFAFHGNINSKIQNKEAGTISIDVRQPENGYWTGTDTNTKLNIDDVINYWLFVQKDRLGFDKQEQQYKVTKLYSESPTPTDTGNCQLSSTKVNGGSTVCRNTLLFEDNFNNLNLDTNKWTREQYIPGEPDLLFVTYEKGPANAFIRNNILHIKPTERSNPKATAIDLTDGCTGTLCSDNRLGTIAPPIISAKLRSKFSFLYGKIEIVAQLPKGDWIFPQLYLEPKDFDYSEKEYTSGRMWIAYSRGNLDLVTSDGRQIGNRILYSGAVLARDDPLRTEYTVSVTNPNGFWSDIYHTYTLTWAPDGITFAVDGTLKGVLNSPFSNGIDTAPFNKEFVVSLGLGVGGKADFPDSSTSNGQGKPWRVKNYKAALFFYEKKANWLPTWAGENSSLKIKSVKVWSL